MHRNPLLMTVVGNPGRRARRPDDAIDDAIGKAWARLMSGVQVPMLQIPAIFRDIKLEMAAGMPLEEAVMRVGARFQVNPNPCHYRPNPYVLIDSATNKIVRIWRGSMTDSRPWEMASDAARRLGRSVFVVAHPYVPPTFKAGVEVSPLFYFGGPFQEVHPDGRTSSGPPGGYKKNPGFLSSVAGGIAGTMVANALANPGPSTAWEEATARR